MYDGDEVINDILGQEWYSGYVEASSKYYEKIDKQETGEFDKPRKLNDDDFIKNRTLLQRLLAATTMLTGCTILINIDVTNIEQLPRCMLKIYKLHHLEPGKVIDQMRKRAKENAGGYVLSDNKLLQYIENLQTKCKSCGITEVKGYIK